MAEKKITKAAATKAAAKAVKAEKPAAKKACAKKACAPKAAEKVAKVAAKAAVKAAVKAAPVKKAAVVYVNTENAGFKAGDVYQTLAASTAAMTPAEVAKKAKCTVEEVYMGLGWLFKEGKVATTDDNKVVLA